MQLKQHLTLASRRQRPESSVARRAATAIERQEWAWVAAISAIIVLASSLPALIGLLRPPPDMVFRGAWPGFLPDTLSYLAKMWQGVRGEWAYTLPYAIEPHDGGYVYSFYLALGHLARLTRLDPLILYQAARIACGLFVLLVIYRFIAMFSPAVRVRRVAFLLAVTASGWGWLSETIAPTLPTGISPMDFWLVDAYPYLALVAVPHFTFELGLLLLSFVWLIEDPAGPSAARIPLIMLAGVGVVLIHPFMVLVFHLPPMVYWLWRARQRRPAAWLRGLPARGVLTLALTALIQWPYNLYLLRLFRTDPVFAVWAEQNLVFSPPPGIYLAGYSTLLLLAALGLRHGSHRPARVSFLVIWAVLVFVLAYAPLVFERRFLLGVQVPLAILAACGLLGWLDGDRAGAPGFARRLALPLVVALAAMSNLTLTAAYTLAAIRGSDELYWHIDLVGAADWLQAEADWAARVLAAPEVGTYLAAHHGQLVVAGHPYETPHFEAIAADIERAFAADTDDALRQAFLRATGTAFIVDARDALTAADWDPAAAGYLSVAFALPRTRIYHVTLPPASLEEGR